MACFIAPLTEAVVTSIAARVIGKKEVAEKVHKLSYMLWGGSGLLAFEHLWHGEIVPVFPFLTAAGDQAATDVMLHEIFTVGIGMALLVTLVWGIGVVASIKLKASAKV